MLLTLPVPLPTGILERHEVEYYLCLLYGLGIPRPEPVSLKLVVAEEERGAMADRLASLGIERGAPSRALNPGATCGSAKRWYPNRFTGIADVPSAEWGAKVVIVGSGAEAALAGGIEAAARTPPVNLAGKTTVRELMALLSLSNLFVTNDSGLMHSAAALGVLLVAIFGPTDPTGGAPRRGLSMRR